MALLWGAHHPRQIPRIGLLNARPWAHLSIAGTWWTLWLGVPGSHILIWSIIHPPCTQPGGDALSIVQACVYFSHTLSNSYFAMWMLHLKLRNIYLNNVTYSLISRNPRERIFVVQISLLISRNSSLMQTTKKVNPHPHIAPCVNMWSVTFLFLFFFLCTQCMLVHASATSPGKAMEWTTLQ
jgi:hypothetical protein